MLLLALEPKSDMFPFFFFFAVTLYVEQSLRSLLVAHFFDVRCSSFSVVLYCIVQSRAEKTRTVQFGERDFTRTPFRFIVFSPQYSCVSTSQ